MVELGDASSDVAAVVHSVRLPLSAGGTPLGKTVLVAGKGVLCVIRLRAWWRWGISLKDGIDVQNHGGLSMGADGRLLGMSGPLKRRRVKSVTFYNVNVFSVEGTDQQTSVCDEDRQEQDKVEDNDGNTRSRAVANRVVGEAIDEIVNYCSLS